MYFEALTQHCSIIIVDYPARRQSVKRSPRTKTGYPLNILRRTSRRGFPDPILQLKQRISEMFPGLPPENPGSKWPKTSLGALKDGQRLTPDQLATLKQVCAEVSEEFHAIYAGAAPNVTMTNLSLVLFHNRCLQQRISTQVMPFNGCVQYGMVSKRQTRAVHDILSEADMPDYWFHASKDGNRASHYTSNAIGATLVHDIANFTKPGSVSTFLPHTNVWNALPDIVRRFRARVDAALPGMYFWFADESLHITVRALMG